MASGTGVVAVDNGQLGTEEYPRHTRDRVPRAVTEEATTEVASRGVQTMLVRLPPSVHGREKQGLVTLLIAIAREKGVSAYVGDGQNRWPAVHRLDAAHAFCLALERDTAGSRYHAVAEQGVHAA